MLTVEARDASFKLSGYLDSLIELQAVRRWCAVGGWSLTIPSSDVGPLLDGGGIVVRDGEQIVFSGPVGVGANGVPTISHALTVVDGIERQTATVTGQCDLGWLSDRVVLPNPSGAAADFDVRTDTASSVILGYVDDNAGPSALPSRRVAGLTVAADPVVGGTITGRGRFQNLLTYCAELCAAGGVTLDATQVGAGVVASVRAVQDLSSAVVFSPEFGNVAALSATVPAASATALYVGGQGELASRMIAEVSLPGVRRVEVFRDRRDIASAPELASVASVALAELQGDVAVTVDPVGQSSFVFGADFRLADLVSVDVAGEMMPARVTGWTARLTADRVETSLTIGAGASGVAGFLAVVGSLSARLADLERVV